MSDNGGNGTETPEGYGFNKQRPPDPSEHPTQPIPVVRPGPLTESSRQPVHQDKDPLLRLFVYGCVALGVALVILIVWYAVVRMPSLHAVVIALLVTLVTPCVALRICRGSLKKAEKRVDRLLRQPVVPSRRFRYALAKDKAGYRFAETPLAELHEHPIVLVKWFLGAVIWSLLALYVGQGTHVPARNAGIVLACGLLVCLLWWLFSRRTVAWAIVAIVWAAAMAIVLKHPAVPLHIVVFVWLGGIGLIAIRFWSWWMNRFGLTDHRLILLLVDFRRQKERNILLSKMTDDSLDASHLSVMLAKLRFIRVPYGKLIVETASARRVYHLPWAREVNRLIISIVFAQESGGE